MRLEVVQRPADGAGQAGEGADLVDAVLEDLLLGRVQLAAAEVFAVGETGVCADRTP